MSNTWGTTIAWAQPAGAAASEEAGGIATQGAPGAENGGQAPGQCGPQSSMQSILLMLAMFAVFYFLLIRPQQKKAKEHQAMLKGLQKGEEAVTTGGLVGRITGVTDDLVTMEVSEKVRVRVLKSQVAGKYTKSAKVEKK